MSKSQNAVGPVVIGDDVSGHWFMLPYPQTSKTPNEKKMLVELLGSSENALTHENNEPLFAKRT